MIEVKRHLAKTISYRILGTLTTIIIGYILTGNLVLSSSLGIIELGIKPLIYFIHERMWYRYIRFGVKD